jgi:enoyl-CoA hydratase/carnithine racemase
MLFDGGFITMATGFTTGLVDQIFSSETVEKEAIKGIARIGAFPKDAIATHKGNRIEEVKDRFLRNVTEKNETFVDCWFSPPVQTLLKEASRKF